MIIDSWKNGQYKEIWVYSKETDDDETMNFIINGELDPFPLSYVLPAEQVMEALEYFEKYHKMPTFITWHDDNFA